jgi:putative lipoic acid-binding regulatory protein
MPSPDDQTASLIEYPSEFPIKVMGAQAEGFVDAVIAVARRHDPDLNEARIRLRPSRAGNYLGITLMVTATSREQLDALYTELSSHPMVKVVL